MNGVISQAAFAVILLNPPSIDIRPCPSLCMDKGNRIPDRAAGSSGAAGFLSYHCLRWCSLEGLMDFCIQENLDFLPCELFGERDVKIKIVLVAMSTVIN